MNLDLRTIKDPRVRVRQDLSGASFSRDADDQYRVRDTVTLDLDVRKDGGKVRLVGRLDAALELADYDGFEARKEEAATRGMLRGIGISTFLEACGIAPSALVGSLGARAGLFEVGQVRVHPTGSITVFTGSHSHGQGHETTFAQLVSDRFGVPPPHDRNRGQSAD